MLHLNRIRRKYIYAVLSAKTVNTLLKFVKFPLEQVSKYKTICVSRTELCRTPYVIIVMNPNGNLLKKNFKVKFVTCHLLSFHPKILVGILQVLKNTFQNNQQIVVNINVQFLFANRNMMVSFILRLLLRFKLTYM